jgi:hypothetical protein
VFGAGIPHRDLPRDISAEQRLEVFERVNVIRSSSLVECLRGQMRGSLYACVERRPELRDEAVHASGHHAPQ